MVIGNTITIQGTVSTTITSPNVNINAEVAANISSSSILLGRAAFKALVTEEALELIRAHTHPTPVGPTSVYAELAVITAFKTITTRAE